MNKLIQFVIRSCFVHRLEMRKRMSLFPVRKKIELELVKKGADFSQIDF